VYASDSSLKGGINDQTRQPIPDDGLELGEITANTELRLDDGKSPRTLPLEISNAPTLTIWLANDLNQGTLSVEVQVTGAAFSFDGHTAQPLRQGTSYHGMASGTHTIRITRDGYEPIERKVELKKGETLPFGAIGWKALVRTASMVIEGATREAEVLVDGTPRGNVSSDGSYRLDDLSPGEHTITLRKADFEDKPLPSRTFTVGQPVRISGAEGQLTPFGSLEFRVTPQSASITYKRADEAQTHAAENGKPVPVRAGRYAISATANGYQTRTETVTVESGRLVPIEWPLVAVAKEAPPLPPPPPPPPAQYFEDPKAWTQDGVWWIHRGGTVGLLLSNQGAYRIEFRRQTVKKVVVISTTRHVEWVIDQRDASNRIEYSFDFGNLARRAIVDGKPGARKTTPVPGAASGDSYTIQVEIGLDRIVIKDAQGTVLDQYDRPNRAAPLGKFGFKGEVALTVKKVE
jgi:hypothetical protein